MKYSISAILIPITAFALLTIIASCGDAKELDPIEFSADTTVASAVLKGVTPEVVEAGSRYFGLKKCVTCHKTQGTIKTVGPVLAGVKDRLDVPHLEMWIRYPRRMEPKTSMTNWDGTDEELIALIAYLRTL